MDTRARVLARSRPSGAAIALFILSLIILFAAPTSLLAETTMVDGVPHIMGNAEPPGGVEKLELEELWRRGGEDDDEILLGLITSVIADADGNLYVLDAQLMEIKVFSPDGELINTLGRQGSGPGEFQGAQQVSFLPDGTLGVAQTFPGKLVGLNLDGTPGTDISLGGDPTTGGFAVLINARTGGQNLVVSGIDMKFDQATMSMDRHNFVRSYSMDGVMKREYYIKDQHWKFDASFTLRESDSDFVWWRLSVDHQGRVLVGEPREEYEVSIYNEDGTLERVFGREYESLKRTEKMTVRYESIMEAQSRQLPPGAGREVAEYEQDLWGIHPHADGSYWVTTSRGMYQPPEGSFIAWDVFSSEGEFLKQVTADIPGTPGTDLVLLTDHGNAVMITGFWDAVLAISGVGSDNEEAEPMEIVCYKIATP